MIAVRFKPAVPAFPQPERTAAQQAAYDAVIAESYAVNRTDGQLPEGW